MGKISKNELNTSLATKIEEIDLKANISDLETTNSQLAQLTNPNLLVNGDFQIWQRGTEFINKTIDFYSADRWMIRGMGGSSHNIIRESSALRPELSIIRVTRNSNFLGSLTQNIENLRQFSNKTLTLSFWARGIGNNFRTGLALAGNYGLGTEEIYHYSEIDVTQTFTKYEITIQIPDLQNKVFNNGHYLTLYLFRDNVAGRTIDISNVKLEFGSVATPFCPKGYAEELSSCQRYYLDKAVGVSTQLDANNIYTVAPTPVSMRALPSFKTSIVNSSGGIQQSGFAISINGLYGSSLGVLASKTSHGLSAANVIINELDAEIY